VPRPQPDLAVAVGIVPAHERDCDLGAVEQAGAHFVLHDAALGEHPQQVEVVDREPCIASDCGALETGVRAVGVAAEHDVSVVVGEKELLAVLPRDPPDRRELRGLLVEMRPHGWGQGLGHGSLRRLERGSVTGASGPELDDPRTRSASRLLTTRSVVLPVAGRA
jgi:hypothetical protein